ncbi:MAG TPA: geranylgeranyl reductase family protein [Anaerolineales bacterium]|nr:geranylgeranyl reductase family protein [Anaerolineales bacterium]
MPETFDVIVVGGGPAGATAAYYLGQAGKRVLVLEKERVPRYKTCGGGLSLHVLAQFPFSFESVIQARVSTLSYAIGRRSVSVPVPDRSLAMVMRADFDAHLLKHSGAEVRSGITVRNVVEQDDHVLLETRQGETLTAEYVVAADGANSSVARSLGLRRSRTLAAAIEVEAPVSAEVMSRFANTILFVFGEVHHGYLWIFPKAKHLSVGIGALHPKPGELQTVLNRVMSRYGISLDGLPLHGHPLPFYSRSEPISTRRTLLVGDAAGLVDPFNGEGIRFAIKSGKLAAEAILADRPDTYPSQVYRQIGRNHKIANGLAALFYHFPRTCFLLGVCNPFTSQAFVDLLSDRAGYPEVILRIFGTLPLFLLAEGLAALAGAFGGPQHRQRVRLAIYPGVAFRGRQEKA